MNTNASTNVDAGVGGNPVTMKTVFTIVERGQGKSYWTKVGVGFLNRDGSITLRLDAIPVNGTLQVRDYEPWDPRRSPPSGTPTPPRALAAREPAHDVHSDLPF